jgi:hypothetical protein
VDFFIPGTVGLGYYWIIMLVAATLAVALTASIWPCLLAIRVDPANTLREGGEGETGGKVFSARLYDRLAAQWPNGGVMTSSMFLEYPI